MSSRSQISKSINKRIYKGYYKVQESNQVISYNQPRLYSEKAMRYSDGPIDLQLQKIKQSILDTSQQKSTHQKERYSFHKKLSQKMKNKELYSFDSNKQIDVLQQSQYLKLLCHQKKYLSKKRAQRVNQLNESLHIEQEDFKHLFMITTQAHYFKLQYPKYYDQLLEQVKNYPKSMFSSIEKDIHRTLINDHPFQSCLRNVLTAFAIRNPNLLYCQGMNYLVAYFLINSVSEEETFWILVSLVQNILPDDYFKDLSTISITTQIFSDVLPYLFPDMGREMKGIGMDCSLFIVSWYVCLFTKGFINSVSSYLLTKLILERRTHSFGFVLLKLSLGVVAAILGRDEPFTFRAQFAAFRDKFESSVFEISLLEIKLGVEYVELNEQNYLKLQKYYRDKRGQKHIETLQIDMKNKRFLLPLCNPNFPICLHRIQIQRKVGNVEEVIINKNGHGIQAQYIETYFTNEPKKESSCIVYESIDDCLLYRQNHICELDILNSSQIDLRKILTSKIPLSHDESFQIQKDKQAVEDPDQSSHSIQIRSSFSKADQKFRELSGYFVVDQNYHIGSDEQIEDIPFEELQQAVIKMEKNPSSTSRDEPFNLQQEFKKHNIKQDQVNSQKDSNNFHDNRNQNQYDKIQISPIKKKLERDLDLEVQLQNQNQTGQTNQVQTGQKNIQEILAIQQSPQSQKNIFSKQKILSFLGKTWRKVVKIKLNQLKN